MTTVAVDAMGGDRAPREVVRGTLAALEGDARLRVLLVGSRSEIQAVLTELAPGGTPDRLAVRDAPSVIGMDEHPVEAVRAKPDASIAAGLRLCREGEAQAFFSAGNTGAIAVAASMALRRVEGVRRPGIAIVFPTRRGVTTLMDAGANLAPRPVDLVQYAIMAAAYEREVLGVADPTVGLLNIGSEEGKGGELVRDAAALCRQVPSLRFEGFVEGHDLFAGTTDVVVCDAFTGNAMLKVVEGFATALLDYERQVLHRAFPGGEERERLDRALRDIEQHCDYAEYGGAPLLGVEGVVIIGHGRSGARAVENGIRVAARAASLSLGRELARALQETPAPA